MSDIKKDSDFSNLELVDQKEAGGDHKKPEDINDIDDRMFEQRDDDSTFENARAHHRTKEDALRQYLEDERKRKAKGLL